MNEIPMPTDPKKGPLIIEGVRSHLANGGTGEWSLVIKRVYRDGPPLMLAVLSEAEFRQLCDELPQLFPEFFRLISDPLAEVLNSGMGGSRP